MSVCEHMGVCVGVRARARACACSCLSYSPVTDTVKLLGGGGGIQKVAIIFPYPDKILSQVPQNKSAPFF